MTTQASSTKTTASSEQTSQQPLVLGWREWISLPALGIPAIKAKIDTGARTSALHAFRIEPYSHEGTDYVRFWLHPLRKNQDIEIVCEAPVLHKRVVKDSGGHAEERFVIVSPVSVGGHSWDIEVTLTDREDMIFRMLLGRTAVSKDGITIDPSASYVTGRRLRRAYKTQKR